MKEWAKSPDFHLRRLASEGLRPKLPWAPKLDTFIEDPSPVFELLGLLKEDEIKFVQKSVANHLTDYLKVNYEPTAQLIREWRKSKNPSTKWIVKHATRKITVD
jgi:3-methyladenine DNA glycosylase AlkC